MADYSFTSKSTPNCINCGTPTRLFVRHKSISDMFQCIRCGLIIANPGDYLREDDYQPLTSVDSLTDEDKQRFSLVFSEGIDTSDGDGNMYADFGMSQEAMAGGLFALVQEAIGDFTSLTSRDRFHVLDVGCATGFLLAEFRQAYPQAILRGVEPSPVSCRKARQLYRLNVHEGTMRTFDSQGLQFDVVTIIGNLQLHEDPFQTLRDVYRVMKPGGLLVYHMKNPFSSARRLARVAASLPAVKNSRLTNLAVERGYLCMRYAASKALLTEKTNEIGFDTLEVRTIPPRMLAYSNSDKAHAKGLVGKIWKVLDQIDTVLEQRAWIQITCLKPKDANA
ncbi:MAG: class I SAM-dependent methyltransferase [Pirellulaceae bacterium]|nr:class I SAM-dependent methyltransferase [Planctomycetales bacterium]